MRPTRQDAKYTTNADRQAAYRARHADKTKLQGMINTMVAELASHPRIAITDRERLVAAVRQLETTLRTVQLLDLE